MGSGKTSVGKELAQELGVTFLDLDRVIESRAGKSIADIFQHEGEDGFRQLERDLLTEALTLPESSLVLAMGGGAFLQPSIAKRLADAGATLVFLDAPPEELHRRCVDSLDAGVRPLLKDLSSFKKLYAERLPVYRQAHRRVDTFGRSVRDIASDIAAGVRDAARNQQRMGS
jgi:shikimate kinase